MSHLRNDRLRNLYYLHNNAVAIKLRTSWAGHATRMGKGKIQNIVVKLNAKTSLAICRLGM
jgi:hypothetical protein